MIPIDLTEESAFWVRQFRDHALFTESALGAPQHASLRGALRQLQNREKILLSQGPVGVAQYASDLTFIHNGILSNFAPPAWPGWLPPSVLRHMIREQTWFVGLLDNRWSPHDFLCLVSLDGSEAAKMTDKMLDPDEEELSGEARKHAKILKALFDECSEGEALSQLSPDVRAALENLVSFLGDRSVMKADKSISMAMIAHEAREAEHALRIIARLMRGTGGGR